MKKRLLSALLILCMVLTLLPRTAWADFTLVDGAIQGQVYGAASGTVEPVGETVNVAVYAQSDLNTALATCTTDAEGVFTLTRDGGFPAGNYTVVLTSNLYLTERREISISSDNSGYTFARIDLTVLGKVYGTVTDANTGAALSGVKVEAYRDSMLISSTTTDASGSYSLEGERGTCQLVFTKDGYDSKMIDTNLSGPLSWELVDVEMTSTGGGTGEGENPGGESGEQGDGSDEESKIIDGGFCGENVKWILRENNVLTISGKGASITHFFPGESPWASRDDIRTVIIEDGITNIGSYSFEDCSSLTSVIIPNSVTVIGERAFSGCSSLTSVTIPGSITRIGNYIFIACSSLTSVTILNGVTSIGPGTFEDCSSLTSVTIPNSVTVIEGRAFCGCSSLTSVTIPGSVTRIGQSAFEDCSSLTSMTVPNGVTSIERWLFHNCSSLTNVSIPNSVTSIEDEAFDGCSSLTSVTIPNSVISIGWHSFEDCSSLISVTIPNSVTSIGGYAFRNCTSLTSVTIPNSVSSIEMEAFDGCTTLTDVYYSGSETDWKKIDIAWNNEQLANATIHYNSTGPSSGGEDSDHFYETDKPVTDTKSLLNSYVSDWYTAYTKFTEAVDKAFQASATTSSAKRDEVIHSQKLTMMEADEKAGSRDSRYISGSAFPDDEMKSAAYEALSTFLYDHIYSAIDLSKVSADDINGSKLVTTVLNGIRSDSETYQIGHVKVAITTSGFGNVSFGMLTCTSQRIAGRYTYGICSSTAKCEQAIRAYMRELVGLETSALYQVYSAVCKDVLGQSLDKLTQKYLSEKLEPYISKFTSAKVGNLLTNLNSCYNYYQYVKKMMGWATSADTPENILAAMQGFEFEDDSIKDSTTKKAWKNLKKATLNLNDAYMCYLSGTLDESKLATWWNSTVDWWNDTAATLKAIFSCPVNVSVYDSSGRQIAYVGDDDIWYTEGLIYIEEKGDAKIVYSFTDDVISFQVSATDYGTLGCAFETYDNEGHPIGRTNYYDIPLYPNKNLSVQASQDEGDASYIITTDGGVIEVDEYILSSQNAAVSISCNPTTGGVVYGDGTYVRGDAVVLLAEPEDGNRFIGWYQGEDLMCTSRIYEFTAQESVEISVVFSANVTEEPESFYTIKLDANDGTENITAMTTDADGTLSNLPVPTRDGYTFIGWYTDAEGGTEVDEETVFTEDTTIYAHWTKDQTEPTPKPETYTVTVSASPAEGGTVTGGDTYDENVSVTVRATPVSGYRFVRWTEGGTTVSTSATYTFSITNNRTLTAVFEQISTSGGDYSSGGSSSSDPTYSIIVPSRVTGGTVKVTPTSASERQRVTITVKPNSGYELNTLTVTDSKGNTLTLTDQGNGKYTFTMPNSKVSIDVSFKATAPSTSVAPINFTDVQPSAYYYDAVVWAVENGITFGITDTTFGPDEACTRAQIVSFLWRTAGSPKMNGSNPFTDVSMADYYYDAVLWAVENGITFGSTDTTFSPNAICTRAQAMTFLYRDKKSPAVGGTNGFTDLVPGAYYTDAVQWAVNTGVTSGTTFTTFSPEQDCTRAQIMSFLYRARAN